MTNSFYRAFEDRYRGSREMIKGRLYKYRPFLDALQACYPHSAALDLGCGRGEWLEVLREQGFAGRGVDLDAGMLAACVELGLDVAEQDAMAALAALPDASVAVVSAFHLVEHIPFDTVRALIAEALRVLVPGGLLIMETPNPENIVVGSCDFYVDPSHLRPIPPNLLAFAAEHGGFARHAVVRLQEAPHLHDEAPLHLLSVLEGASPDYSIVAQKGADQPVLDGFDALFAATYGLTMKSLALRYESQGAARHAEIHHILGSLAERISADRASTSAEHQQVSGTAAQLAAQLAAYEARMDQLETVLRETVPAHVSQAEALLREARAESERNRIELADWRIRMEGRLAQSDQHAAEQTQRIAELLQSRSWRITAPLRWFGIRLRVLRSIAQEANAQGNSPSAAVLGRVWEACLRRMRLVRSLAETTPDGQAQAAPPPGTPEQPAPLPAEQAAADIELPPRATRIYRELKQAQQARKD